MPRLRIGALAVVCSYAIASVAVARAQNVQPASIAVAPISVELGAGKQSEAVAVTNAGDQALVVDVRAYAWQQSESSNLVLSEAAGLLVYPRRLVLGPHETHNVRVGSLEAPSDTERAYRLSFTQIEDPSQPHVEMITYRVRVTMPVFLAAAGAATPATRVARLVRSDRAWSVRIANDGTEHDVVRSVAVAAFDRNGARVAEAQSHGWYALPRSLSAIAVTLPPDVCARAQRFVVTGSTERAALPDFAVDRSVACSGRP